MTVPLDPEVSQWLAPNSAKFKKRCHQKADIPRHVGIVISTYPAQVNIVSEEKSIRETVAAELKEYIHV